MAIINTFIQVAACIGPSLFIGILSTTSAGAAASGADASSAQAYGFSSAVATAAAVAFAGLLVSFFYAQSMRAKAPQTATAPTPLPTKPDVGTIMKHDAFTVPSTATVHEAMHLLLEHKTSGLPVVDVRNNVVGFISDGDIMKTLAVQKPSGYDLAYGLAVYRDGTDEFNERLSEVMKLNVMELCNSHRRCDRCQCVH